MPTAGQFTSKQYNFVASPSSVAGDLTSVGLSPKKILGVTTQIIQQGGEVADALINKPVSEGGYVPDTGAGGEPWDDGSQGMLASFGLPYWAPFALLGIVAIIAMKR